MIYFYFSSNIIFLQHSPVPHPIELKTPLHTVAFMTFSFETWAPSGWTMALCPSQNPVPGGANDSGHVVFDL